MNYYTHDHITWFIYCEKVNSSASERLTHAVVEMPADDLLQVYNELFPEEPASEAGDYGDVALLVEPIVEHIRHGLEPEEVVDLWNVVFPGDRAIYFDEEDKLLHYGDGNGHH